MNLQKILSRVRRRYRVYGTYLLSVLCLLLWGKSRLVDPLSTESSSPRARPSQRKQCHAKYGRLFEPLYNTLKYYKSKGNMTRSQLGKINCPLFTVKIIDNKVLLLLKDVHSLPLLLVLLLVTLIKIII